MTKMGMHILKNGGIPLVRMEDIMYMSARDTIDGANPVPVKKGGGKGILLNGKEKQCGSA